MKKAGLALFALLCLWHVALRWHGLRLPLTYDEGDYSYVAKVWSAGGLPYRDVFDQKPPNIYLLYRLGLPPRYLAIAFCWATMALLFLMTPKTWKPAARWAGPAVYAALSTTPIGDYGFAANTEVFLAGFTALAAWALVNRRLWLCGLACGAALMTKQTAIWTVLAFAVFCDRKKVVHFAANLAVIPALWLAYFFARGGSPAFLADAVTGNMRYAAIASGAPGFWFAQLRWFFGFVAPRFLIGDWPAYALALAGLKMTQAGRKQPLETLAALWLGTALCGAFTGLFLFPHYFLQAAPALALLAAVGVQRLAEKYPKRPWPGLVVFLALYPAAAHAQTYFLTRPLATAKRLLYPNPLYESIPIADYIREHSAPEDTLYIYGSETQIYVYAQRFCATPYSYSYPFTLFAESQAVVDRELAAVALTRPKFIVYSAQPLSTMISSELGLRFRDGVRALLARDYVWSGEVIILPGDSRYSFGPEFHARKPDLNQENRLFLFEHR